MPSSTAPSKQQADVYKRVVRMLARAFYTRNVPEKDPNAPEPRTDTQRRKAKEARLPGLHVGPCHAMPCRMQDTCEAWVPPGKPACCFSLEAK